MNIIRGPYIIFYDRGWHRNLYCSIQLNSGTPEMKDSSPLLQSVFGIPIDSGGFLNDDDDVCPLHNGYERFE